MAYTLRDWQSGPPAVDASDMHQINDAINDLDTRTGTVETRTTDGTHGNTALDTRLSTVESDVSNHETRISDMETGILVVSQSADLSATSGGRQISWDTVDKNDGGFTVSSDQITIPSGLGGWYLLVVQVVWNDTTDTGTYGVYGTKNGTGGGANGRATSEVPGTGVQYPLQAIGLVLFAAGDTVYQRVYSSDSQGIRGTSNSASYGGTWLSLKRVSL